MENLFNRLGRYFGQPYHLGVLETGRALWRVTPGPSVMPYLKAQNVSGRHIVIRPTEDMEPYYMLIDDLDWETIKKHHQNPDGSWKPGRMVVETSPGNFQVWIHSNRSMTLDEKRFWLFSHLKSDPGADPNKRWGRCPGFTNRKEKYRDNKGNYPWSRLIWADYQARAHIPVVTIPEKRKDFSISPRLCFKNRNIIRDNYDKGDESRTDFAYTLALLIRGFTDNDIRQRILAERQNWDNKPTEHVRNRYLERTIERAHDVVQQVPV